MSDVFHKALRDIARGYSSGIILSRPAYIKHMSYADQTEHDIKRDEYIQIAKDSGILNNAEKEKQLIDQGFWTQKENEKIKSLEMVIAGMIEGKKKNAKWPSMVEDYMKKIKAEQKSLDEKSFKKNKLLGLTCESYAEAELNDYYIFTNLFADSSLTAPLFPDLDDLGHNEVKQIVIDCNSILSSCSEENIKKLAMQGFLQRLYSFTADNIVHFFGRPICSLSFFQTSLLSYASIFRSILTNNDMSTWPEDVKNDPDLLIEYAANVQKNKEEQKAQGAYDENVINVGLKPQDSKVLGVKSNNDLAQQVAASGGSLIDFLSKQGR